jgi:hypothetical protein
MRELFIYSNLRIQKSDIKTETQWLKCARKINPVKQKIWAMVTRNMMRKTTKKEKLMSMYATNVPIMLSNIDDS